MGFGALAKGIYEGAFGGAVKDALSGFGRLIDSNASINLVGKEAFDGELSKLRFMKTIFEQKDTPINMKMFEKTVGTDLKGALKKYDLGDAVTDDTIKTLDDRIATAESAMAFNEHEGKGAIEGIEGLRAANKLRGGQGSAGIGGFAKSALNYYTLGDLERNEAGKLIASKGQIAKTFGARAGTTVAGVWGTGKAADILFGSND